MFLTQDISRLQQQKRLSTHQSSALYQSRSAPPVKLPVLKLGDEVVVKSDRSKSAARDVFVVLQVDNSKSTAVIQKFPMNKFRRNPLTVQLQNFSNITASSQSQQPHEKQPLHTFPSSPTPFFPSNPSVHTSPQTQTQTAHSLLLI